MNKTVRSAKERWAIEDAIRRDTRELHFDEPEDWFEAGWDARAEYERGRDADSGEAVDTR